ncbi:Retrotransposon protein [Dorcoceras hygrometricum]|uniref:Retrotransposon protein n=1 Tax=Dorcoceras hygrometricum TaxID=472368 RepID=A0A2Z7AUP3_9LAMI|nr:Retrotransposon protein [Dorcoceras hygrometricum]
MIRELHITDDTALVRRHTSKARLQSDCSRINKKQVGDSDESTSSSSSSDDEEDVQCLMADDTYEVFDFSSNIYMFRRRKGGDGNTKVTLPPSLASMYNIFDICMLRKNMPNPSHVLNFESLQLTPWLTFEERAVRILGRGYLGG